MPSLKANIGGSWVELGGGTEVFIGPDDPGGGYELWFDTDDPGLGLAGQVESASYTPTLTNWSMGTTGAKNVAGYTYNGQAGAGGKGLLTALGELNLGAGFTMSASVPAIGLPSGFNFDRTGQDNGGVGMFRILDANPASWPGWGVLIPSGSLVAVNLEMWVTSGAYLGTGGVNNTTPITWAQGDAVWWQIASRVVRV